MTTATANANAPYPDQDTAAAVTRALAAARDRPNPDLDASRSAQKYASMAQNFRASAWEHLAQGDLAQASNKAWGVVAETVKAISAHHGGIIHAHRSIWMVTTELARLTGSAGDMATQEWIINAFGIARLLHANFYEDGSTADDVRAGLRLCEELSRRLYELFWPEGAPPGDAR